MLNPHGEGLGADRTAQPQPARFMGIKTDPTLPVAVGVVLSLLGEELMVPGKYPGGCS